MIASRLILWHTYSRGVAFDLSEHGNHGTIVDAVYGDAGFPDALHFTGGPAAVWVKPSRTLSNLGCVRTQVHFHWDPTFSHRHNLIEGELAFALFVNPDGSLQGTILNALGNWLGAQSPAGMIVAGQWHTAELLHDGISTCKLYLNGALVAEDHSSPGPVGSVAARGLAVGHWPEPSDVYSLEGYIDSVKVWSEDPEHDSAGLIDGCCIRRAQILRQLDELAAHGLDGTALGDAARTLIEVGRETAYYLTQGSAAERDRGLALGARLLSAYQQGDAAAVADAVMEGASRLQANASPEQLTALWTRLEPAISRSPVWPFLVRGELAGLQPWLAAWCLQGWVPQPSGAPANAPQPTGDASTDPDTDAPSGKTPPGWSDPTTHEPVRPPDPSSPTPRRSQ